MFETVCVGAAGAMFGAVRKPNRKFPVLDRSQLHNAARVHDAGTMDTKKLCRVEPLFQRSHGFAQQVGTAADVQFHIIPSRPDPFDILRQHDLNSGSGLHREPGGILVGGLVEHLQDAWRREPEMPPPGSLKVAAILSVVES